MKKQVVVIGMGRFGTSVATRLCSMGHSVLVLDRSEAKVQSLAQQVTHAVRAEATNEEALKELGISNFDVGIVAIGTDIKSSVLTTILLKRIGLPYVIARANDELHGAILEKIGADAVTYPERAMGISVANWVTLLDVSDYMPITDGYGIARLTAPPNIVGEKLSELGLGRAGKWDVAVLLIQRPKEIVVTPGQGQKIEEGDVLVLAGEDDKMEKFLAETRKKRAEE